MNVGVVMLTGAQAWMITGIVFGVIAVGALIIWIRS